MQTVHGARARQLGRLCLQYMRRLCVIIIGNGSLLSCARGQGDASVVLTNTVVDI